MNRNLKRLCRIAEKKSRTIIGTMSGTSFDGLDIALCRIKGNGTGTKLKLLRFETIAFDSSFKEELKSVFAKKDASLEKVCLLNPWIATRHAELINACLKKWNISNDEIDLLASHGQTIYHAPRWMHLQDKFPNSTLQIGDGDHLAFHTGIITLSDFRQKHIAAGGEGAPLAVYGDYLLFSKKGENRVMLNIGGISNFTWLPASNDFSEVVCTDIGPGNTMMDAYVQENYHGKYFDEDASIASKGKTNETLLEALKADSFFKKEFPKTTGPELFNLNYVRNAQARSGTKDLNPEDVMATLNRFTGDMIVDAFRRVSGKTRSCTAFSSGGGIHNPLLMKNITSQLPGVEFHSTDELGINPDAKEAILFALLANESICGKPINKKPGSQNGIPGISMGKISFPL